MLKKILRRIRCLLRYQLIIKKNKKLLFNQTPCIISSNCNGGIIYHDLELKFLSPTINLFFYPKDYLKFVMNLEYYLSQKLCPFTKPELFVYPIGMLDDIEVHFMHYKTFEEAVKYWEKRIKRVNFENLFFVMTDRDGCTYEQIKTFDELPYKNKVIFTHKKYHEFTSSFYIKGFEDKGEVGILSNFRKYSLKRYLDDFNYVDFLNNNEK